MPKSPKIQSGDIFSVPLADGRFGIAQVVFSHYSKLMMGVLAFQHKIKQYLKTSSTCCR